MVDTSRIYALSVKSSSSVQELKQLIYDVDGIPPDKQYLTFACKPLDDYLQISNYSSAQPGVAFAVSLHLVGGMDEMDDGMPAVEPPVALALSPAAAPGIVAGAADTSNDAEPPAAFFRTYTFETYAHDRSVVVKSNGIVLGAGPPPGQVALSEDRMAANLASHLCRCEPLLYELSCRGARGALSSLQSAVEQMANLVRKPLQKVLVLLNSRQNGVFELFAVRSSAEHVSTIYEAKRGVFATLMRRLEWSKEAFTCALSPCFGLTPEISKGPNERKPKPAKLAAAVAALEKVLLEPGKFALFH